MPQVWIIAMSCFSTSQVDVLAENIKSNSIQKAENVTFILPVYIVT